METKAKYHYCARPQEKEEPPPIMIHLSVAVQFTLGLDEWRTLSACLQNCRDLAEWGPKKAQDYTPEAITSECAGMRDQIVALVQAIDEQVQELGIDGLDS